MSNIITAKEAKLGDRVVFRHHWDKSAIDGCVIAKRNRFQSEFVPKSYTTLLGFKDNSTGVGWNIEKEIGYYSIIIKECDAIDNFIQEYKYGWWLPNSYELTLIEPTFNFPDQVCIGCRVPAPHAKPNHYNSFLCVSCSMLREVL